MLNDITVTVLESGAVRIDTDSISGPAHSAAEKALMWIIAELGGEATRERRATAHTHQHGHDHDHNHDHTHA